MLIGKALKRKTERKACLVKYYITDHQKAPLLFQQAPIATVTHKTSF
jgi:hypothetical protein